MAKTAEEIRESNRRRSAAYRERKKQRAAALPSAGEIENQVVDIEPEIQPDLQIEVNAPESATPMKSLKERLFGGFGAKSAAPPPAIKKARKKQQDNLISTVLPTVLASFIATYAQDMLPAEYKVCAPSSAEMNAIIAPLLAIIGRRVEIAGKASQDVIDITNAIVASAAYGARAFITYKLIKKEGAAGYAEHEQRQRREYRERIEREARDIEAAAHGAGGDSSYSDEPGQRSAVSDSNGDANDPYGDSANGGGEAAIIANMLRRDKQGRVRLGLLPAAV